jgi:hypothetical protein
VSPEPPVIAKPPGFLWIVLLGAAGFCAGFFGPMVFMPDSNLGPIIGILFSGPAGAGLGLVMFLLMKLLPLPARSQWILLTGLAAAAVLTTLFFVQPEPATRGYELELTLERTRPPCDVADAVVADWNQRIAGVTWAAPRAGWEAQMRRALAADPGLVLEATVLRERTIKEHRELWNRGRLFATPWRAVQQQRSYYLRPDARALSVTPSPARLFLRHDSSAPIRAPEIWPPAAPEEFIGYSRLEPVPAEYAALP